jgi:hypothetical protein
MTDARRVCGLPVDLQPLNRVFVRGCSVLVSPAEPKTGPTVGRVEVSGGRDRTDARHCQAPGDAILAYETARSDTVRLTSSSSGRPGVPRHHGEPQGP